MRRYESYVSALAVLREAPEQDMANEFVMSGIVDKFRLQFELAWKLLKKPPSSNACARALSRAMASF